MPLESTATHVDDLVVTNPEGGDLASRADDHLRLLKKVLKNSFPNMDSPVDVPEVRTQLTDARSRVTTLEGKVTTLEGGVSDHIKDVRVSSAAPPNNLPDKTLYLRY